MSRRAVEDTMHTMHTMQMQRTSKERIRFVTGAACSFFCVLLLAMPIYAVNSQSNAEFSSEILRVHDIDCKESCNGTLDGVSALYDKLSDDVFFVFMRDKVLLLACLNRPKHVRPSVLGCLTDGII